MNNAAMSGTHYPLDKEPRGRRTTVYHSATFTAFLESQKKISRSTTFRYPTFMLSKLIIIKAFPFSLR